MRQSAVIDSVQGLGLRDHVGWTFDQPADFQRHAGRFLAEGLAAGQRVVYVGGSDTPAPIGVAGLDAAVATGQAELTSVGALYSLGEPVDPERQVHTFADATAQALADGWAGLRVAADVTSLVMTSRQRDAWIRYEHLADGLMTSRPLAGLCGFRSAALDATALSEITCVHPAFNGEAGGFRLYASTPGVALAGELDRGNGPLLAAVLRRARPAPEGDRFLVDATDLAFVDHHALAQLAAYAAEWGVTAVLHARAGSVVSTIARLVPMSALEVQEIPV